MQKENVAGRMLWVDDVKLFACALVVVGHLLQSFRSAGIVSDSGLLQWFDHTIYFVHVPLFFICSGFLQRIRKNRGTRGEYCIKKGIALGLPYIFWSLLMWGLKQLFEGSVNNPHRTPLIETLILEPISPYWYLYVLLLFVCLIPVAEGKQGKILLLIVGIGIHLAEKVLGSPYGLFSAIAENLIWYIVGIAMPDVPGTQEQKRRLGYAAGGIFICGSILVYVTNIYAFPGINLLMGFCGCSAVICCFQSRTALERKNRLGYAQWIYPVYMLHTIFAAPARIVLHKLGIQSALLHIVVGLLASFAGPILYELIARKIAVFDFLLYPQRYLIKGPKRER